MNVVTTEKRNRKMTSLRIDRFNALISRRPTASWFVRGLSSVLSSVSTGEGARQRGTFNDHIIPVTVPHWIARLLSPNHPTLVAAFSLLGAMLDGTAVQIPVVWSKAIKKATKDNTDVQLSPVRLRLRYSPRELTILQQFGREAMVTDIPSSILTAVILGLGFITGLHGIMSPPWHVQEFGTTEEDDFLVPNEIRSVVLWLTGRHKASSVSTAGNILVRDQDPVGCISHILTAAWESGFGRHLIPSVEWSDRLRVQVNRLLPKFVINPVATQRVGLVYRVAGL